METISIREAIYNIVNDLVGENQETEIVFDDSILHVILSESSQALDFVCQIEDEFEIEFDDDDIDLSFFLSFEVIIERVKKHLN